MAVAFSLDEARTIAVSSQGFGLNRPTLEQVYSQVCCLQIDPLKAIRESHEIVCLSRGVPLVEARSLITSRSSIQVFAYPAHAMALLPASFWPWFAFSRRRMLSKGWRGPEVDDEAIRCVRALLQERRTITVKDFAKGTGTGWNRSSLWRIAAEWLLWTGEAVSTTRNGSYREYALSTNVIPEPLISAEPSDDECFEYLVGAAINALGIATLDDIADYFRLRKEVVERALTATGCPRGIVEGWSEPVWFSRRAESLVGTKLDDCVAPLSPFDSLVWYRPRLQRLFGKTYKFEAYKKADERVFGHYFMPVLCGNEIVGRIAPRRKKHHVSIEACEFDMQLDPTIIDLAFQTLNEWSEATLFTALSAE